MRQTSSLPSGAHRARISRSIGYGNLQTRHPETGESVEREVFTGQFTAKSLPSGIACYTSDLTVLTTHVNRAALDRSLMVRMLLSPQPTEVAVDKRTHRIEPQTLFALRCSEPTEGTTVQAEGASYLSLGLFVRPEQIVDDRLADQVDGYIGESGAVTLPMTRSIAALATELIGGDVADAYADYVYESWALNVIAQCFSRAYPVEPAQPINGHRARGLLRVRDYMEANLSEPLSVQILASEAAMSLSVFKDSYRRYFGESPFETIRRLRLARAHRAISSGRLTIKEAAFEAGYRHTSSFSAAYLNAYGERPGGTGRKS